MFKHLFRIAVEEVQPHFEVTYFPHGKALLNELEFLYNTENIVPDVILLDMEMPYLNGLETLGKLNGSDKFYEIPVFLFLSMEQQDLRMKAQHLGCEGFIEKPMDFSDIETIVVNLNDFWIKQLESE